MEASNHGKALPCRVGHHKWVTRVNANARWEECRRCGKYSKKVITGTRFLPGGTGDSTGGQ